MRRLPCLALAGVLALVGAVAAQTPAPKLEEISYPELGKLVRAQKGKPVLVYVWAHY